MAERMSSRSRALTCRGPRHWGELRNPLTLAADCPARGQRARWPVRMRTIRPLHCGRPEAAHDADWFASGPDADRQAGGQRERPAPADWLAAEVALIRVDGTAGGGMVTIRMDGHKNVLGVKIDPEVAGDVEMLQDLVLAASNDAAKKVDEESQKKMGGMLGGLGLPPGLF